MPKFNAAFWKWFGDSKVVDATGRPLVVYHGTTAQFSTFTSTPVWFTSDRREAAFYGRARRGGAIVIAAYLRIRRPYIDKSEWMPAEWPYEPSEVQKLRRRKHDGIIWEDPGGQSSLFVAFDPEQIKSIGNDGTWDADDPDIRSNPPPVDSAALALLESPLRNAILDARLKAERTCGIEEACYDASEMLCRKLRKLRYNAAVASGYFRHPDNAHTWVELGGLIIDITADQFNDPEGGAEYDPITIRRAPHKWWREKRRRLEVVV